MPPPDPPPDPPSDAPPEQPYYPTLNPVSGTLLGADDHAPRTSPGRGRGVVLVAALVPIVVGIASWQVLVHASSDPSRTVATSLPSELATVFSDTAQPTPSSDPPTAPAPTAPAPVAPPANVLSPTGYAALRDAVRTAVGTTTVVDATLYPAYAVVGVPDARGDTRRFRWDGSTLEPLGTAPAFRPAARVDLARVSGTVVVRLSDRVRRVVPHATAWYVLLRADPVSTRPSVYAYANDAVGHGAYVLATPAGKVQRTARW